MDGSSESRCTVTTVSDFDLRDSHFAIEVPRIFNYHPEMSVFLAAETADAERLEFGFQDGSFYGLATTASLTVFDASSAYEPAPGHWRIREQSGTVFFEASFDRINWFTEMQFPTPFAVDHVRPSFGVATSGPMAGSVGIQVPGFNTLP
jgi:hypothetical protein